MAGVSSNSRRSPSPTLTRPNPNPNPNPNPSQNGRNHHNTERDRGVMRKSFSGNPYSKPSVLPHSHTRSFNPPTPANSPADYGSPSSLGRECTVSSHDYEQKENEKDPNSRQMRVRSPSLNGTKSFMSPTISAASKIIASTSKKVLSERKEAVRTSASLLDGKFHFFSVDSVAVAEDSEPMAPTGNSHLRNIELSTNDSEKENKKGREFSLKDSENEDDADTSVASNILKLEEPDLVVLSPEKSINSTHLNSLTIRETPDASAKKMGLSMNNADSSPCVLAPFDADPSLPPYDPETNYLSPRPQFLHYRPNPRIKLYLNNGKRLEEIFSETESSQETPSEDSLVSEDASSVEMAAEECQDTSVTVSPDAGSSQVKKRCEDASSDEVEVTKDLEHRFSYASVPLMPIETVPRETALPKSRFGSRSKAITYLFFLSLVLLPFVVLYNPSASPSAVLQSQIISKLYNDSHAVAQSAKVNLNALLPHVRPLAVQFGNYLFEMSCWLRQVEELSLSQFSNSTSVHDFGSHAVDHTGMGFLFKGEIASDPVGVILKPETPDEVVPDWKSDIEMEEHAPDPTFSDQEIGINLAAIEDEGNYDLSVISLNESEYVPDPANQNMSSTLAEGSEICSSRRAEFSASGNNVEPGLVMHEKHDIASGMQDERQDDHSEANYGLDFAYHDEGNFVSGNDIECEEPEEVPESRFQKIDSVGFATNDVEDLDSGNDSASEEPEEFPERSFLMKNSIGDYRIVDALPLGNRFLDPSYLGMFLVVCLLTAIVGIVFLKPKKASSHEEASELPAEKFIPVKEASFHGSPSSCSYSGGPIEVSEPCPSEMSSFQRSSSCYRKKGLLKEVDEVRSEERKPRRNPKREPLDSPSKYTIGSSSYGSFSTYDMVLHSKHGDEEIMTPVRRSSRIRKHQVTCS